MNRDIMPSLNIGLVQINNSFSKQVYFPYSVACLQSYVVKNATHPEKFNFLELVYKRMPISDIVAKLTSAHCVGFSTYVWNINISLEVARRLKEINPDVFIIFGGPQVPNHADSFLRDYPFIDLVFHGESEPSFLAFLEAYPNDDWRAVQGISYLTQDGELISTPAALRLRDLSDLPSPFLDGMFDKLMQNNPEESWIGLWETNRGCPFRCSYCDWGSATAAKVSKFEINRLLKEADWFSDKKIEYIFVCDANFGMLQRDIDIVKRVAENHKKTGYPQGFSVQNTKNATERAYITQKILSDAGLNKGVALSVQSLSPIALKNIRRDNISLETYFTLQQRFTRDKVATYSDMILGLPGETYESFIDGIDQLLESGQHNRIQFNNCAILPNAEMAEPEFREKFNIETVFTEIINIHGHKVIIEDDVAELQELVVSNYTLSKEDWRNCRAVAWMTALLLFDKTLIIPLVLAHTLANKRYRDLIQAFMEVDADTYPVLSQIRNFFLEEAASIQAGGTEYTYSEKWLGIYWPADEYILIQLNEEKKLDAFYDEAERLLSDIDTSGTQDTTVSQALRDAFTFNRALINRPYVTSDISLDLSCDIAAFYESVREGTPLPLQMCPIRVNINCGDRGYDNFENWCREIIWWGNKKGAYLHNYNTIPLNKQRNESLIHHHHLI